MTPVGFLWRCATALLCLTPLAGCGIPDGIAYGVKAVQHYNDGPARPAATPVAAPAPAPAVVEAAPSAPPPATSLPSRRDSITVEELPPGR